MDARVCQDGALGRKTNWTKDRALWEIRWGNREEKVVRTLWKGLTAAELAERLGRTPEAVRVRAKRMGVARRKEDIETPWSHRELAFIMTEGKSMSEKARALGRTRSQVSMKMYHLRKMKREGKLEAYMQRVLSRER